MPNLNCTANAILVRQDGLLNNRLIVIRLKDTIAATDGDAIDAAWSSHFSTRYDPLYANSNRIRTEIGRFIQDIPDDTINQLAWKWSLRADILRARGLSTDLYYGVGASSSDLNQMILSDYVTAKTALSLLTASPDDAGYQKSLADLRIGRQAGALRNAINWYETQCIRLEEALLQGGFLGIRPQGTAKGMGHSDRPAWGREWARGPMPAAQAKARTSSGTKYVKGFGASGSTRRGTF